MVPEGDRREGAGGRARALWGETVNVLAALHGPTPSEFLVWIFHV